MKVRDFCREPGFTSAIILTWSFDAVFFERVMLQDLAAGGARVPLILADRRQATGMVDRWPGQVQYLGRRYVLETAAHEGSFHPKLILRIGPKGGLAWLSTGNMSPAGFGGNRELATSWKVGPGEEDEGSWIPNFLDQVDAWCSSPATKEITERVRAASWLSDLSTRPSAPAPIIWTRSGATLAQQLEERWRGRRFDTLHLMTGSTDEGGEFLTWAHKTFGVQKACVAVHASRASFSPDLLERLPLAVRFIEPPEDKPLHAKCYWFDGPDGPAALFGSPNCSASAWLRPLASGGNVETAAVFDQPVRADWNEALKLFDAEALSSRQHLIEREGTGSKTDTTADFTALFIEIDLDTALVRARVTPAPPKAASVTLVMGDDLIPLKAQPSPIESVWEGPLPEDSRVSQALFAFLRISTTDGVYTTPSRWVDKRKDLREAYRDNRSANVLGRFGLPLEVKEQQRVLEDLQLAMDTVLTDRTGFPDVAVVRHSANRQGQSAEVRNLDPQQLAVALREFDPTLDGDGSEEHALPTTFHGVMNAFFPNQEAEPAISPEEEFGLAGLGEGEPPPSPEDPPAPVRHHPAEHLKKRLQQQLSAYLIRLEEPHFADSCTATQLVQAVSFPLAIATLGTESGWVDQRNALDWSVKAISSLLYEHVPESPHRGLLGHVAARYASDGRSEIFNKILGDGLLWTVATVALAALRWDGPGWRLQRALLLRDIFEHQALLAVADVESLKRIASRLRNNAAMKTITEEVPRISDAMADLEAWLTTSFDLLVTEQAKRAGNHEPSDPLWRPGVGWVFVVDPEVIKTSAKVTVRPWRPGQLSAGSSLKSVKSAGFYVNVRLALAEARDQVPPLP